MRVKLLNFWYGLRASYWFIPSVMMIGAFLLAILMIELDQNSELDYFSNVNFLYLNQPDGARALLSTVAGSVIGVAGVTFSITMAVLSLTSSQFGPRLLRNFMRDQGNQIVLGTFVATFLYSLLILRTIHTTESVSFVPQLSVTVAVVLAIVSMCVFIYFIHHTAASIQISTILHDISRDIYKLLEKMQDDESMRLETLGKDPKEVHQARIPEYFSERAYHMKAERSGYLTALSRQQLIQAAIDYDLVLKVNFDTGEFITKGEKVLEAYPVERYSEALENVLRNSFGLSISRTPEQDVGFLFQQLMEIALRSLSPGINDPFTAVMCIDRLGEGFAKLAKQGTPSGYYYHEGDLRLVLKTMPLDVVIYQTFSPIRHYAKADFVVSQQLLQTLFMLMEVVDDTTRESLRTLSLDITEASKQHLSNEDYRYIVRLAERLKTHPYPSTQHLSV